MLKRIACAILLLFVSFSVNAESELKLGFVVQSFHYDRDTPFNESHNGIYLKYDHIAIGTYLNSHNNQSIFVAYESNSINIENIEVSLLSGFANNYGNESMAWGEYMPIVGANIHLGYVRISITPMAIVFGAEF